MDFTTLTMVTISDLFNRQSIPKMTRFSIGAAVAVTLLAACAQKDDSDATPAADTHSEGQRIATNSIIVDTHIDVPYRLQDKPDDVSVATDGGDFDYPRAVAGGLNAPFMSIYTPAELEAEGGSRALAEELITMVEAIVEAAPDKFATLWPRSKTPTSRTCSTFS